MEKKSKGKQRRMESRDREEEWNRETEKRDRDFVKLSEVKMSLTSILHRYVSHRPTTGVVYGHASDLLEARDIEILAIHWKIQFTMGTKTISLSSSYLSI